MTTERQAEANRLNAMKSTGPRTPEGRAMIGHNAMKHGLLSREIRRAVRIMQIAMTCVALLWLSAVAARAELSAAKFLQNYESGGTETRDFLELMAVSFEGGMGWANAYLTTRRKQQPIYCVPDNLALSGRQLIDILQRSAETDPVAAAGPFGHVLQKALIFVFPCPE